MWPDLDLPIRPPYPPMEARLVGSLPLGDGWQYEPKWDGFRCLVFRDGATVALQSKAGQPLDRYFPEVVEAIRALTDPRLVVDGELVVPADRGLSFERLLQRIHPADRRVRKLAGETPAVLIAFDLLVDGTGASLVDLPLAARRARLEAHAARWPSVRLSPATSDAAEAERWHAELRGAGIDGIVAKRTEERYVSGERAMLKVKAMRTADCVVGGYRASSTGRGVGSLLLGLYDDAGLLHHVGHTAGFDAALRVELDRALPPLVTPPGFTGSAPGPSRWSRGRSAEWIPLDPVLVVEVRYHHFSEGRFRHGTQLLRFRPDKAPRACTFAQVRAEAVVSSAPL